MRLCEFALTQKSKNEHRYIRTSLLSNIIFIDECQQTEREIKLTVSVEQEMLELDKVKQNFDLDVSKM